jgi:hypothetical protein
MADNGRQCCCFALKLMLPGDIYNHTLLHVACFSFSLLFYSLPFMSFVASTHLLASAIFTVGPAMAALGVFGAPGNGSFARATAFAGCCLIGSSTAGAAAASAGTAG